MRLLTAVALALVMLWVPVDGVAQMVAQRNPLKGVTTVKITVFTNFRPGFEGGERIEASYKQEMETAFELGLLRAGLKLGDTGVNGPSLWCDANVVPLNNGRNHYVNWFIHYEEVVAPPGSNEIQYAITWHVTGSGYGSLSDLDGRKMGEMCAETFELEWRRANN